MRTPHHYRAWLRYSGILLQVLSPLLLVSQPIDTAGRWSVFPLSSGPSPFFSRYYNPMFTGAFYFTDSVTGYSVWYSRNFKDTSGEGIYRTKDKGATWHKWNDKTPFPHEMYGSYGISRSGQYTADTGRTWQQINFLPGKAPTKIVYDNPKNNELPEVIAALYRDSGLDRLCYSLDNGKTWIIADSIKEFLRKHPDDTTQTYSFTAMSSKTLFGHIPIADSGQFTEEYVVWKYTLGISDSTLYAIAYVEGLKQTKAYLCRINLFKKTMAIRPLGSYPNVLLINKDFLLSYYENENRILYSINAGEDWDTIATPRWVQWKTIRFFPSGYMTCATGWSSDTGKTWHQRSTPYGPGSAFFALDSAHLFLYNGSMLGPYSQLAWSSDAGYSWQDNGVRGRISTGRALNGTVLGITEYGHFLRSTDSAEHWTELRAIPNAIPSGLARVQQLQWPNPETNPEWVVALAQRTGPDQPARYALIESRDTGASWRVTSPSFDDTIAATNSSLQFLRRSDSDGLVAFLSMPRPTDPPTITVYRSFDTAKSWQYHTTVEATMLRFIDDRQLLGARQGALLRSEDGGKTWGITQLLNDGSRTKVADLVVFNRTEATAIVPEELFNDDKWTAFHSSDGGKTWDAVRSASAVKIYRGESRWISRSKAYLLTGSRLAYTADTARSFVVAKNLPIAGPWVSDANYFYFLSMDSLKAGRWRLGGEPTSGIPSPAIAGITSRIVSNPVQGTTARIQLALDSPLPLRLQLIDSHGLEQLSTEVGLVPAGGHTLSLDISGVSSGEYFVILHWPDGMAQVLPLMVVR
ncbi:MAG: hypothetical protein IT211_03350 [Armatimonadetes bacterium]|nr:hypothetical protein [Armatimonadota bacterium]